MHRRRSGGSALVLVLVSAIVLSILVGALFTLFKSNVDTQRWAKERIQARFTAEAGLNMAVHMIMGGADVPQGDEPLQMLPETGSWHFLGDELGWVQVWVDPDKDNDQVSSANAYEVRCLAKVVSEDQDYYYGIASLVMPRNFAVYATFLNGAAGGYFGDGYRFDGPFHANSAVMLYSKTAGRDNDPWFYSFSTTEDYYLYGTSSGELAYEPHHKNLYMEPYERMIMGEPYFVLGAEEIPFGSDEVTWEGTYNAAVSGGLVLNGVPDGTRMILLNDTLLVRENEDDYPVARYPLANLDNPVVWINNNPSHTVYLKSEEEYPQREHGLTMGLTIGVEGNLAISGPILYNNMDLTDPDNNNMLGLLVVYGDFLIAHDPDMSGDDDWEPIEDPSDQTWRISTDDTDYPEGIQVDAVVMALDGVFQMEDVLSWPYYEWPHEAIDFEIVGGYIINEEYITTWESITGDTWGYLTFVTYDPRLMSTHPPYFPQTGKWDTAYWDERPDMTDDPTAGDDYIGENVI